MYDGKLRLLFSNRITDKRITRPIGIASNHNHINWCNHINWLQF